MGRLADGGLVAGLRGGGLLQLTGEHLRPYPLRQVNPAAGMLSDRDVDANRLLWDRDGGGLWIGTVQRGLVHVRQGRADVFDRTNGLSGDVVLCLFEDREGSIWVSFERGAIRDTTASASRPALV